MANIAIIKADDHQPITNGLTWNHVLTLLQSAYSLRNCGVYRDTLLTETINGDCLAIAAGFPYLLKHLQGLPAEKAIAPFDQSDLNTDGIHKKLDFALGGILENDLKASILKKEHKDNSIEKKLRIEYRQYIVATLNNFSEGDRDKIVKAIQSALMKVIPEFQERCWAFANVGMGVRDYDKEDYGYLGKNGNTNISPDAFWPALVRSEGLASEDEILGGLLELAERIAAH